MTAKSTTGKRAAGRPSEYTEERAELIIVGISTGMSLRTVLQPIYMPDHTTFYRWMRDHASLRTQYAQACRDRADAQFEEMTSLHEEAMDDVLKYKEDPRFANVIAGVHKLKADNMKWAMAQMKPKKYGARAELDDLPQNAIVFVNEVPAPQHQSNTGDLLPDDDQSDPDQTTD